MAKFRDDWACCSDDWGNSKAAKKGSKEGKSQKTKEIKPP
jgi:hypothetical protein